jgi:Sugar phosphate permease
VSNVVATIASRFRSTAQSLWAGGTGWILIAVGAGWAFSIGVRFIYPTLVPSIRADFGIGLSTTGLLLTLLWASYAIGHVPGGILGDYLGPGKILTLSATVSTAAVLLVATAVNTGVLFVATVGFGLATALYGPTRFTVLTDIYPDQSGSAIGLSMAAGNVGNAVFPVVAAAVAGLIGWRAGFGVFVPLFALVAVGLWVLVPARTSEPTASASATATDSSSAGMIRRLWEAIDSGKILAVVAIQVSISFIIQGFASFYPVYLIEAKGVAPATAATLFGGFFALGVVIQPASGSLMDRLGMRTTLIGFLSGCVLALWLLPLASGLLPLVGVTALFAAWNGTAVVTQTYIAETLPADMQGTGLGTLKAGWMLLGATAPLLVGFLADTGLFDQAFFVLAGVGSIGVTLAVTTLPGRSQVTMPSPTQD